MYTHQPQERITATNQPNLRIRFENVTAGEALTSVLENQEMEVTGATNGRQAIEILRKKGQKVAASRAERDAKEGIVLAKTSADGKKGILVAVNSETDFVARNEEFATFAETLAAGLGTDGRNMWNKNWNIAGPHVMSPPLNPDPTVKKYLMQNIHTGNIHTVGSDNCTFCLNQKKKGENIITLQQGRNSKTLTIKSTGELQMFNWVTVK